MNIGYARVSTQDQTLNLQKEVLEKLGCNKICTDTRAEQKLNDLDLTKHWSMYEKEIR